MKDKKHNLDQKFNYYMKRKDDSSLSVGQRKYASDFLSGYVQGTTDVSKATSFDAAGDNPQFEYDNLRRIQSQVVKDSGIFPSMSAKKQGRLAVINDELSRYLPGGAYRKSSKR